MNTNLNKLISSRIKELRHIKGITSEQLAYRSGISKGGLSEIERNLKEPRLSTIIKICAGFEITASDFFSFNEIDDFINKI